MIIKLKYLFLNFRQRRIQFFHFLEYGKRIVYNGLLAADGKYKIAMDSSNSKILFGKGVSVRSYCNFLSFENGILKISENVFINNNCSFNCLYSIEIGSSTIFGEGVKIYDHNHNYKDNSKILRDQGFSVASVKIGNNCWIGSNVVILKGVTIGDNSIIGAGCLIYKNIPANSIVKNNAFVEINNY